MRDGDPPRRDLPPPGRGDGPGDPLRPAGLLARLWEALILSLPDGWTAAVAFDEGDNGWQLDPNG